MTVIDEDQWEPCSPSYLDRGGRCDAPRVWDEAQQNHWHPKLASPQPEAYGVRAGIEALLDAYDAETTALPLGHEMPTRGSSTYNWRRAIVEDLRKLAALSHTEQETK
jgi:hypothetical protein